MISHSCCAKAGQETYEVVVWGCAKILMKTLICNSDVARFQSPGIKILLENISMLSCNTWQAFSYGFLPSCPTSPHETSHYA